MNCLFYLDKKFTISNVKPRLFESYEGFTKYIIEQLLALDSIEERKKVIDYFKKNKLIDVSTLEKNLSTDKLKDLLLLFPVDYVSYIIPNDDEIKIFTEKFKKLEHSLQQISLYGIDKGNYILNPKANALKYDYDKANIKRYVATKFIGFGAAGTSTYLYEQQLRKQGFTVNSENYDINDIVFVSINGNVSEENFQKTLDLCKKALNKGAILIVDSNEYLSSSSYNKGEKRLAKELEDSKIFKKETVKNAYITIDGKKIYAFGIIYNRLYLEGESVIKSLIPAEEIQTTIPQLEQEQKEDRKLKQEKQKQIYFPIDIYISTDYNFEKNLIYIAAFTVINYKEYKFVKRIPLYKIIKFISGNEKNIKPLTREELIILSSLVGVTNIVKTLLNTKNYNINIFINDDDFFKLINAKEKSTSEYINYVLNVLNNYINEIKLNNNLIYLRELKLEEIFYRDNYFHAGALMYGKKEINEFNEIFESVTEEFQTIKSQFEEEEEQEEEKQIDSPIAIYIASDYHEEDKSIDFASHTTINDKSYKFVKRIPLFNIKKLISDEKKNIKPLTEIELYPLSYLVGIENTLKTLLNIKDTVINIIINDNDVLNLINAKEKSTSEYINYILNVLNNHINKINQNNNSIRFLLLNTENRFNVITFQYTKSLLFRRQDTNEFKEIFGPVIKEKKETKKTIETIETIETKEIKEIKEIKETIETKEIKETKKTIETIPSTNIFESLIKEIEENNETKRKIDNVLLNVVFKSIGKLSKNIDSLPNYIIEKDFYELYSNNILFFEKIRTIYNTHKNIILQLIDTKKNKDAYELIKDLYSNEEEIPEYILLVKPKFEGMYLYDEDNKLLFIPVESKHKVLIASLYITDEEFDFYDDWKEIDIDIVDINANGIKIRPNLIFTTQNNSIITQEGIDENIDNHAMYLFRLSEYSDEKLNQLKEQYKKITIKKKTEYLNILEKIFPFAVLEGFIIELINIYKARNRKININENLQEDSLLFFKNEDSIDKILSLLDRLRLSIFNLSLDIGRSDKYFNDYKKLYIELLEEFPVSLVDVLTSIITNDKLVKQLLELSTYNLLSKYKEHILNILDNEAIRDIDGSVYPIANEDYKYYQSISRKIGFILNNFGSLHYNYNGFFNDLVNSMLFKKSSDVDLENLSAEENLDIDTDNFEKDVGENAFVVDSILLNNIPLIFKILASSVPNAHIKQFFTFDGIYKALIKHLHNLRRPFEDGVKHLYINAFLEKENNLSDSHNYSNINIISRVLLTYNIISPSLRTSLLANEIALDLNKKFNYTARSTILAFDINLNKFVIPNDKLIHVSINEDILNSLQNSSSKLIKSKRVAAALNNPRYFKKYPKGQFFEKTLYRQVRLTADACSIFEILLKKLQTLPALAKKTDKIEIADLIKEINKEFTDSKNDLDVNMLFDTVLIIDKDKEGNYIYSTIRIDENAYSESFYKVINDIINASKDKSNFYTHPFYILSLLDLNIDINNVNILDAIQKAIEDLKLLGFKFKTTALEVYDIYTNSGLNKDGIKQFFKLYINTIITLFNKNYVLSNQNALNNIRNNLGNLNFVKGFLLYTNYTNAILNRNIKNTISIEALLTLYYDTSITHLGGFKKMHTTLPNSNSLFQSAEIINDYLNKLWDNKVDSINVSDENVLETLILTHFTDNKIIEFAKKKKSYLNISRLISYYGLTGEYESKNILGGYKLLLSLSMFAHNGIIEFPQFGNKTVNYILTFEKSNIIGLEKEDVIGPLEAYLEKGELIYNDAFLKDEIQSLKSFLEKINYKDFSIEALYNYFIKSDTPIDKIIEPHYVNELKSKIIPFSVFANYLIKSNVLPRLISYYYIEGIFVSALKKLIEQGYIKNITVNNEYINNILEGINILSQFKEDENLVQIQTHYKEYINRVSNELIEYFKKHKIIDNKKTISVNFLKNSIRIYVKNIIDVYKNVPNDKIDFKEYEAKGKELYLFHTFNLEFKKIIHRSFISTINTLIERDVKDIKEFINDLKYTSVGANELQDVVRIFGKEIDREKMKGDIPANFFSNVKKLKEHFTIYLELLNRIYLSYGYLYHLDSWIFYGNIFSYDNKKGDVLKRLASFVSSGQSVYNNPFLNFSFELLYPTLNKEIKKYTDPIIVSNKLNFSVIDDIYIDYKNTILGEIKGVIANVLRERNIKQKDETSNKYLEKLINDFENQFNKLSLLDEGIKSTDGAAITTLHVYRFISQRIDKWSNVHEYFYNKIVNGEKLNNEEIKFIVENHLVIFPPIKMQYAGTDGSPVTFNATNHKYCIFPIIPQLFDNDPIMVGMEKYMIQNNIHYLIFKSANKISLPVLIDDTRKYNSSLIVYNKENDRCELLDENISNYAGTLDLRYFKFNTSYTNVYKTKIKLNKKMLTMAFNLVEKIISDKDNLYLIHDIFKKSNILNDEELKQLEPEVLFDKFKKLLDEFIKAKLSFQTKELEEFIKEHNLEATPASLQDFIYKLFENLEISNHEKKFIINDMLRVVNGDVSLLLTTNFNSIANTFVSLYEKYFDKILRPLFTGNLNVSAPPFIIHDLLKKHTDNFINYSYKLDKIFKNNFNEDITVLEINGIKRRFILSDKKYEPNTIIKVVTNKGIKEVKVLNFDVYNNNEHGAIFNEKIKTKIEEKRKEGKLFYLLEVEPTELQLIEDKKDNKEEQIELLKSYKIGENLYNLDERFFSIIDDNIVPVINYDYDFSKTISKLTDIKIDGTEQIYTLLNILNSSVGLALPFKIKIVDFNNNEEFKDNKSIYYKFVIDKNGNEYLSIYLNKGVKLDETELKELIAAIIIDNIRIQNTPLYKNIVEDFKKTENINTDDDISIKYALINKFLHYLKTNQYKDSTGRVKNWFLILKKIFAEILNFIKDKVLNRFIKSISEALQRGEIKTVAYKKIPEKMTLELLATLIANDMIRFSTYKHTNEMVDISYIDNTIHDIKIKPTPFATTFTEQFIPLLYYISPIDNKLISTIDRLNEVLLYNIPDNVKDRDKIKARIDDFINNVIIPYYTALINRTPLQEKSSISISYPAYFLHPLYSSTVFSPSLELYKMDSDFDFDKLNIIVRKTNLQYKIDGRYFKKLSQKERDEISNVLKILNKEDKNKMDLLSEKERNIFNKHASKITVSTNLGSKYYYENMMINMLIEAISLPHNFLEFNNMINLSKVKDVLKISNIEYKPSKFYEFFSINNNIFYYTASKYVWDAVGYAVYSQYNFVLFENAMVRAGEDIEFMFEKVDNQDNPIMNYYYKYLKETNQNGIIFNDSFISKLTSMIISGTVDFIKDDWLKNVYFIITKNAYSAFAFMMQYYFNIYKLYYKNNFGLDEIVIQQMFLADKKGIEVVLNIFRKILKPLIYLEDLNSDGKKLFSLKTKISPVIYNFMTKIKELKKKNNSKNYNRLKAGLLEVRQYIDKEHLILFDNFIYYLGFLNKIPEYKNNSLNLLSKKIFMDKFVDLKDLIENAIKKLYADRKENDPNYYSFDLIHEQEIDDWLSILWDEIIEDQNFNNIRELNMDLANFMFETIPDVLRRRGKADTYDVQEITEYTYVEEEQEEQEEQEEEYIPEVIEEVDKDIEQEKDLKAEIVKENEIQIGEYVNITLSYPAKKTLYKPPFESFATIHDYMHAYFKIFGALLYVEKKGNIIDVKKILNLSYLISKALDNEQLIKSNIEDLKKFAEPFISIFSLGKSLEDVKDYYDYIYDDVYLYYLISQFFNLKDLKEKMSIDELIKLNLYDEKLPINEQVKKIFESYVSEDTKRIINFGEMFDDFLSQLGIDTTFYYHKSILIDLTVNPNSKFGPVIFYYLMKYIYKNELFDYYFDMKLNYHYKTFSGGTIVIKNDTANTNVYFQIRKEISDIYHSEKRLFLKELLKMSLISLDVNNFQRDVSYIIPTDIKYDYFSDITHTTMNVFKGAIQKLKGIYRRKPKDLMLKPFASLREFRKKADLEKIVSPQPFFENIRLLDDDVNVSKNFIIVKEDKPSPLSAEITYVLENENIDYDTFMNLIKGLFLYRRENIIIPIPENTLTKYFDLDAVYSELNKTLQMYKVDALEVLNNILLNEYKNNELLIKKLLYLYNFFNNKLGYHNIVTELLFTMYLLDNNNIKIC